MAPLQVFKNKQKRRAATIRSQPGRRFRLQAMPLSYLSRFRTPLMGFAILWIVFYHSLIPTCAEAFPGTLLHFLHRTGYGGVDLFFLLSGLGLAFSRVRHPQSTTAFWKRRLLRLAPLFLTGTLIWVICSPLRGENFPSPTILFELFSGLGFWLNGPSPFWFLPAIAAAYLLFPPLAQSLWRNGKLQRRNFLILLGLACLIAIGTAFSPIGSFLLIFLIRLPLFILGAGIGFRLNEPGPGPRLFAPVVFLAGIAGAAALWFVFWHLDDNLARNRGLYWFPFWLLTTPLCLGLASLIELSTRFSEVLLEPLEWAGRRSLELYLAHTVIFCALPDPEDNSARWCFAALSEPRRIPETLVYFIFAVLAAELLGQLQAKVLPLLHLKS